MPPSGLVTAARVVGALLVYLVAFIGSSVVLYGLGSLLPDPFETPFALVSLGIAEGVALVAVLGLWLLVDRRPLVQLGLETRGAARRWLRGAGVAALMMGFVVFVGYTLVDGAVWSANPDATRAVVVLVGGFIGYVIQGPSEEVLFRGYVLENLRGQWGVPVAVVVSSLAFGAFHAFNPAFGPLPLINLVLFGLATALYKVRLDGQQLWGVFAIHTIWNWLQQVVFGLPNSGLAPSPDDALFSVTPPVDLPGPLAGGGFGPEGTLAASLVLLALIGVCLRARSPRPAARGGELPVC